MIILSVIDIDQNLFTWINVACTNSLFDAVLPLWRNKYVWIPLYVFIAAFLLINFGKKGYWVILSLLLTIAISDIVSSRIVKNSIERIRPCNSSELFEQIIVRVHCGSGYSFTSSHACNHFAISIFLILFLFPYAKYLRWALLFWACSIAFAQVYVGVHYPLDVIAGGALGTAIGMIVYRFYIRYFPHPMELGK